MSQTQETIVWVDAPILGNRSKMSQDGRFTIEQKGGYYFLRDTTSGTTEPCNAKRLPLKGCKALAEEIVAGEKEDNQTKEGEESVPSTNLSDSSLVEQLTDSTNALTDIDRELDEIEKLIQDKENLVSSHELQSAEKVVELTEGHHFPGDPFPSGPDNLPKAKKLEIKRVFPPSKEKTLVSMDYKELELPGFNLSKVLAPSVVPFRVMTMRAAESRTKTKSRGMKIEDESLRGGTTDKVVNPVPVVHHKLKTREEVQQILNRLMVEKGVNLPNWADWIPILRENGVDPIEVRQGMLAIAEKWAREHAEEEAAKKRQPRQVALEHLPLGTTFRIPSMADTFDVGVLLDKNPASAKVRITQGCKDKEIDWSLGTLVVVVGKVELEKHRPSGDNETQALKVVEDVLPPWETTEDEMKIRIDVAKKLLVALGLAATAVKKMSAKKVATKINSIEKHLEEADKVEGENLKLLEKIADWRQENADGTIKITGGEDLATPEEVEETETPAEEHEEETEQKEEEEVKETKEKAPKKGKKAKPEKAPKEEVQEKPSKKTKPKTEENGKEEKKTKPSKVAAEGQTESNGEKKRADANRGTKDKLDKFGTPVGSSNALVNACLSKKPKSFGQLVEESGLTRGQVRYSHLEKLVKGGQVVRTEEGWKLA